MYQCQIEQKFNTFVSHTSTDRGDIGSPRIWDLESQEQKPKRQVLRWRLGRSLVSEILKISEALGEPQDIIAIVAIVAIIAHSRPPASAVVAGRPCFRCADSIPKGYQGSGASVRVKTKAT